jgi:hypothetical protein
MKLNCGLSREEKRILQKKEWGEYVTAMEKWHDFYAIWPRRVGSRDCRMFEVIQRRGCLVYRGHGSWAWKLEYKVK